MGQHLFIALEKNPELQLRENFDYLVDHISVLDIEDENFRLYELECDSKNYVGVKVGKKVEIREPLTYLQCIKVI